ncbi:MAG: methyltransferase family protein [Candidatus Zipacnadales bacterium]
MGQTTDRFSRLIWKLRGKLLVIPYLTALLVRKYEYENDLIVFGLGGFLFALGLALRVWAQMHLHFRLRMVIQLTMTGPYAYVRNPIYLANVLMACGLCIGCELLWMLPWVVVYCAVLYTIVVRYEETTLLEQYGEPYAAYLQRVPRWVPKLRWQASGGSMRRFLAPSLRIEALSLLYWLPVLLKELASDWH